MTSDRNANQGPLHTADPHFSGGRIGQEFDVPDALPQFIEGGHAALQQRGAVDRRLDALRASFE